MWKCIYVGKHIRIILESDVSSSHVHHQQLLVWLFIPGMNSKDSKGHLSLTPYNLSEAWQLHVPKAIVLINLDIPTGE